MIRRLLAASVTAVLALAGVLSLSAPAKAATVSSTTSFDTQLINLMNDLRASNGAKALTTLPATRPTAVAWSKKIGATGSLTHASLSRIGSDARAVGCTGKYGENLFMVDGALDPAVAIKAYRNSPGHRAAILDKGYTHVASGTAVVGGRVYNTVRFLSRCSTTAALKAPAKKTTKVSGWARTQAVVPGKAARDRIAVTGAKRTVKVQRKSHGVWKAVKTARTNAQGKVTVVLPKHAKKTTARYRLVVTATSAHTKATTKTKTLTVR